jgi:hypothetical protein
LITLRKSKERGHFNFGWLDTYHSFSFGDYYDPAHMGFHALRVINEDVIEPGQGFPLHGHRDMEIVTYILEGELEHRDSLGNRGTIRAGEIQRMSAGKGIRHSEYNASDKNRCHLLQIWILPEKKDLEPGYEQKKIASTTKALHLIAAPPEQNAPLTIHQNVRIYAGNLSPNRQTVHYPLEKNRHAWIQIARGLMQVNGIPLKAGDGAAISLEEKLFFESSKKCEFLLFDMKGNSDEN